MAAARTLYAGSDKPSYSHSPAIAMFLGDFLEPVPLNVRGIIMEHLHTLYAATPQSTGIQTRKARHEISVLSEKRWQFYCFFSFVGGWCVCGLYAPQNWSNGDYLGKDSHHFPTDQKPYHLLIIADMMVVICIMIVLEIGRGYRAN